MDRRVVAGIAIVCLLLVGVAVTVLVPPEDTTEPQLELAQTEDVDETLFEITVLEDGDVRWTVEHRQRITDDEAVEEFRAFADRFEEEETETFENFVDRADRLTEEGTAITGREMAATDFERSARYDEFNRDGVIEMSFRWEGFAQQENSEVVIGDVFDGGFVILEEQRLRIDRGDDLEFTSVSPEPDETAEPDREQPGDWIEWSGPREFDSGEIEVRLAPPDEMGEDDTANGDEEDTDDETNGSGMMIPFLVAVLVLAGIGGGAVWYTITRSKSEDAVGPETPAEPASEPSAGADAELEAEQLLSDEDRVIKLLEENGGRMRQVSIVEETEWSKSKVSMLLSDMEEDGEISKLRVGRENIISLAGEEPEAAGSPFEDDE